MVVAAVVSCYNETKIGTGNISALNGYRAVEIYSPMEVVENEND